MARRALGPATLLIVQAVERALTSQDRALLVACSGGADSLALAAAAQCVLTRRRLPGSAVVVDHGLQPDSAQVAARAREQLSGLGFADVSVSPVEVDLDSGLGLEAAARQARYRRLEAEAASRGATVLLGHTLDDQAETVLLGLARGSGTRSLAGMNERTYRYLRPMLRIRRRITEQACAELGLQPWHDPHNADPAYARSRVRSRVLPVLEAELGPGVAESLSRTAQLARDDADLLDDLAKAAHPPAATLDGEKLADLPAALRRRVIRGWLADRGAAEVTYRHVVAVEELITDWHGQQGLDLAGIRVTRAGGQIVSTG